MQPPTYIAVKNYQKCLISILNFEFSRQKIFFGAKFQILDMARFARNIVKWDFLGGFLTIVI